MEFVLSILLTLPFIVGVLVISLLCELKDAYGWSTFLLMVAGATSYFFFTFPSIYLLYGAIGYFPVGFIWSFWRWRVYCRTTALKIMNRLKQRYNISSTNTKSAKLQDEFNEDFSRDTNIPDNKWRIVHWVLVWPLSIIQYILSDLVRVVEAAITRWLRGIYDAISNSATKNIDMDMN